MEKIVKNLNSKIVVMTGAGISAESGIKTFRDSNGLWRNYRIEEVASPIAFKRDPKLVWEFYLMRRKQALECRPNPGHIAIAQLEKKVKENGGEFLLITQNVDGLHKRAGSENIVEIHGNLIYSRCTKCGEVFEDRKIYEELPPFHHCGGMLRPHIVWFGEYLNPEHLEIAQKALENCDIFIVIGTSGVVYPAAGFVNIAKNYGKKTVCVNKDKPANIEYFDEFYQGKAGELLPEILF